MGSGLPNRHNRGDVAEFPDYADLRGIGATQPTAVAFRFEYILERNVRNAVGGGESGDRR